MLSFAFRAPGARLLFATCVLLICSAGAQAGSIFLTGHDPDFHAQSGLNENPAGARRFNQVAINFILDPTYNPFARDVTNKFLFVQSKTSAPNGHRNGEPGIILSGYLPGVSFETHDASTLTDELGQLGTKYAGIVVASDFGGILTQAELDILNANSSSIINFLNAGGGLYAMGESNGGARLTSAGGHFDFLPFIVTGHALHQPETHNTVTAYGASLGLTNSDVNGNFSHMIFTQTGGLQTVDHDGAGHILSIAGRGQIDPGTGLQVVPVPSAALGGLALLAGTGVVKRLRRKDDEPKSM